MKLIELLGTLNRPTFVRIEALDIDVYKITRIAGEASVKGWSSLMTAIEDVGCAEYTVTSIHCLWHAQELYIECAKW